MNMEHLEALRTVDPKHLGYGAPSALTRQLIQDGLIEQHLVSKDGLDYWYATLTASGKKALK